MTDFLESVLNSMSSAFNSSPTPADGGSVIDLNLNEDKTLKWRSLYNNSNAVKFGKKSEGTIREKMSQGQDSSETNKDDIDKEKVAVVKKNDGEDTNKMNTRRGKNLQNKTKKLMENSISASRRTRRSRQETSPSIEEKKEIKVEEKIPKRRGRARKNPEVRDSSLQKQSNMKKTDIKTEQNKEDDPTTESTKPLGNDLGQDNARKLRRSERISMPEEIKTEDTETIIGSGTGKVSNENNLNGDDSEPKGKKIRRSERLENKYEIEDSGIKVSTTSIAFSAESVEIKEEPKKIIETESTATVPNDDESDKKEIIEVKSVLSESIPKRRGRRTKIETQEKALNMDSNIANKKLRISKDTGEGGDTVVTIATTTKKEKVQEPNIPLPQRPLRRIKPTAKILENDELRYEYETKNIARITACTEADGQPTVSVPFVQENEAANKSKKDQKEDVKEISKETVKELRSSQGSSEIKKKLFPPTENCLSVDNIYPVAFQRPCPDPQTLLSEIKAEKINLYKSPENKKLNRKQHRKLLKQKEKHFEKLGLRKNDKDDRTETEDDSSSDNEEFLPPRKLNVGRPNVTLRLRNKENSPVPCLSKGSENAALRKRVNSRLSSSAKSSKIVTSTEVISSVPLQKEIKQEKSMICLCRNPSHYYTRNTPDTAFCCAIDSIEGEKVGCCNQLSGEILNLLRPSYRVGYMILCDDHKKRLLAHNCCASCGIFCTQGKFILCKQEHFFHAECAQKYILNTPYDPTNTTTTYPSPILVLKCPHCGCDTPEKTSIVTMKCKTLPVFLPSQRAVINPAKMTVPEGAIGDGVGFKVPSIVEMDKLIPESVMNIVLRHSTVSGSTSDFVTRDMFYAINNDDLERVAEIIASGYDITCEMPESLNGTCLHLVAHFGTVQMAYLLLCRESSEQFLNMIDKELRTPAMCAIIGDKCDILKLFIQCGADLSLKGSDGMTCLHMAVKLGSIAATKLIVESYKNSTSISNFKGFINAQDDGGWTALVWAAENGYTDVVSFLLNHEADPNVCDLENNTVLHWATCSKRIETIIILLQGDINCNQQNILGETPLHIACRQSNTRICLMLIANGADLMVKNRANQLPYDCIPSEESQCARAVGFNMQMRSFGPSGLRNKVVCSDVSNGREAHPIQAVRADKSNKSKNDVDDDIILPDFKYITKSILQNSIQIDQRVLAMRVCSCSDGCSTDVCQCSSISLRNWYTLEGRLIKEFCFEDPPIIFECNDVCGCNKLMCKNRVVQSGIKVLLQVFECEQRLKGWGVRSLCQIPRGTFVSEYTGEILTDMEADRRTDDSYFFDLGADYCIDANYYGNVSRFFNHSCSPNIVPVRVYYEHQDYRFPKIAFFACKDILIGEELSFDYGEKFWAVKQKYISCQCETSNCRYSTNTDTNTNTDTVISIIS